MRADWDDAPLRVKGSRKTNRDVPVIVIALIVAGGLGYGLYTDRLPLDNPFQSGTPASPSAPAELISWSDATPQQNQSETLPPRASAHVWSTDPVYPDHSTSGRQTSFNDSNYRPSNQINIIASVPVTPPQRTASPQSRGLSGSSSARVAWVDARGRRTTWHTTFSYRGGVINNSSFCLEQGRGSIEYRECRKGAREWLKDRCRTTQDISDEWRQMYCRAHSGFRT